MATIKKSFKKWYFFLNCKPLHSPPPYWHSLSASLKRARKKNELLLTEASTKALSLTHILSPVRKRLFRTSDDIYVCML